MPGMKHPQMTEVCRLPNGATLYRSTDEVGHSYWSDEVGGGGLVWQTALVSDVTMLAAIVEERRRERDEEWRSKHPQDPGGMFEEPVPVVVGAFVTAAFFALAALVLGPW